MLIKKTLDSESLSFVIQATNDGIWDWDLVSNQIYFSPRYKAILGYKDDEFTNSIEQKFAHIHPDDIEQELEAVRQYLAKETSEYKNTYRMLHKDNSWHWIMSRAIALWGEDEKVYRMLGSQTDITEQKALEQELMDSRDKAEEANRAKSDFLANMSHELRTPMNAVLGIANILVANQTTQAKHRELITTLQLSAQSLMNLINDLLDIAKFESNDVKLEHIPFNLAEMIEEVISIISVKAEEKHIELNVNYAPVLNTEFIGDPLRIRQILMNLVSNSVKFTNKGSVTIDVQSICKTDCKQNCKNIELIIKISDTGIGIAADKIEMIFSKFSQADTYITRKYGGTGLGLSICKTLISLMNGNISVTSTLNKGSCFTITIMLETGDEGKEKNASEIISSNITNMLNLNKPLILLVEDHKPNVLLAGTLLENLGYRYEVAGDGKKALKKMEHRNFDIILMDIQMPEMDGLETTRHIRKNEKKNNLRHIPIIAMTAHALTDDREKCLKAGMDDYISKPFNFNDLKNKLEHFSALPEKQ